MATEPASQIERLKKEAQALMDERGPTTEESGRPSRLRDFVHFWVLVGRSFARNRCPVRASALAFSSLLAMIPMLALVLSVTTSILKAQGEKPIRAFVDQVVQYVTPYVSAEDQAAADDEQVARARAEAARAREEAVQKINEFIDKTQSGTIGATSAILLMFVAISMLSRIEATFNDIWGVARSRPWYVQIMLYWTMITLGPVALISALGLATAGQLHLSGTSTLAPSDLKTPAAFITRLTRRADPVSESVWERLSDATRARLAAARGATPTNLPALVELLVNDLNKLLEGPRLYDPQRFAAVTLSPETRKELAREQRGPALLHLNRLVLEDAFPGELARSSGSRWGVLRWITEAPLVQSLLSTYLPALVLSVAFALVYLWLPNTRVQYSAALIGGLTAGLLWHLNNKLGVLFVSRITSNNAVYGSLGMVPVFMIGLYFGWLILLFGAQVGYVYQNRRAYLQERLAEGVHHRGREFAALRLVTQVAQRFHHGDRPPTLPELAVASGVPTRLGGQLLSLLVKSHLLLEVYDRELRYAPARPLDRMNVQEVLDALRTGNGQDLATRDDPVREVLRSETDRFRAAESAVAKQITLQQLIDRTHQRLQQAGTDIRSR